MRTIVFLLLFSVAAFAHTVTLTWNASTTLGVTYNVWRSTTEGTGYVQVNTAPVSALTYKDKNVWNGATYYYVVTAFDGQQNSNHSNEVAVSCYCHIKHGVKVCGCYINTPAGMSAK